MAYQSFFATNTATRPSAATPKAGSGYTSFFGNSVQKDNTYAASDADQKKQQAQQPAAQQQQPKQSLFDKVKTVAKGFASSATTGEQKFAQGIARDLPGGTNDLKAQERSANVDTKNLKTYTDLHKAGKITDVQYQKLTGSVADQSSQTSKGTTDIEKSMPTKAQIGLGAASTAADILTAGTLGKVKGAKAGLVSEKAIKPLIEVAGKKGAALAIGGQVAGNATAGGLNAAAGGGTKSDIIKNAAAGAALPIALHTAGHVGGSLLSKVSDSNAAGAVKAIAGKNHDVNSLINKTKLNKTLPVSEEAPGATVTSIEHDIGNGEVPNRPTTVNNITHGQTNSVPVLDPNTGKALHDTMATVHQPKAVADAEATQKAATEATAKLSEQTAKDVAKATETTKKIDQQLEVYDAKAKDAEGGKLSNVDQVKIKQLKEQKAELAQQLPEVATSVEKPAAPTTTPKESLPDAAKPEPAQAATKPSEVSSTKGTPEADRGTSKIAQSVQEKAVARGLKDTFGEAGGYDKIKIADQAKKAVALTNDRPALDKVISGEAPLPNGLRATALIKAVEEHPVLGKDPEIIRRLSQAEHLTGESSRSAQELRLAAERSDHSPVEAARQVREARQKAFERKSGKTVAKGVSDEVKAIRAAKASTPKPTKETFASFVDSLKC